MGAGVGVGDGVGLGVGSGPLETVYATGVPGATMMPGAGAWATTDPTGISGSNPSVRVPTTRPAVTTSCSASDSVLPRRSGTGTATLPRDTVTLTVLPDAAVAPSAGSWVRMMSGSTSVRSTVAVTVIVRPTAARAACASALFRSTTLGTTTAGPVEALGEGLAPPPVRTLNRRKPTTIRMTMPRSPATQAHGLDPPGSSSSRGGGGGAPVVETGAVGGTWRAYASGG